MKTSATTVLLLAAAALVSDLGVPALAGEPAYRARFGPDCMRDNSDWKVSSLLRKQADWADRFQCATNSETADRQHLTVEVRSGDGYDDTPNSAPSERAEIELKRAPLVHFDQPVWYRFAFRIEGPWRAGANRTVIHQIKQNIAKPYNSEVTPGAPCDSANPFFRVHLRELSGRLMFLADVAESEGCPSEQGRHAVCATPMIEVDRWHIVNVALKPSPAPERGVVQVWLDGAPCGQYRGRFGYPTFGVQRDGRPTIDAPPRFGIYRDALPFPQRLSFQDISFWTERPSVEDPAWRQIEPPELK